MEQRLETTLRGLRKLTSAEAADWLLENCPLGSKAWGDAMSLLPHLSWKEADQLKLARHYLSKIPYASAKPYEVFVSFMTLGNFIRVLKEFLPSQEEDKSLLKYHLKSVLSNAATTDAARKSVEDFLAII